MKKKLSMVVLLALSCMGLSAQSTEWLEIQAEQFEKDTASVEQNMRDRINENYSTVGMIDAANFYEQAYDSLLNKYYNLAISVLTAENQELLRQSQRKWLALRDADKDLISGLVDQAREEAGGGTVWGVIGANERADVTRRRVIELYNYMMLPKLN